MTEQFKWVDYYEEFASKLLEYRNNRKELIDKIVKVYDSIEMKLPKLEARNKKMAEWKRQREEANRKAINSFLYRSPTRRGFRL